MATPKTSPHFCAPDADLTVSSSDGVLFKVHRKNLETHSGMFAGAANATRPPNATSSDGDETVELSEPASAAEKYMVYAALTVCRMRMEDAIPAHPLEVLLYALRHDHIALANESAQQSMGLSPAHALEILPPETFRTWIQFYERWHRATVKSLLYMATFPQHLPLVQRCAADPSGNPVCTFRRELDEAGGWARTIREGEVFVEDPRVKRIQQCNTFPFRQPVPGYPNPNPNPNRSRSRVLFSV
ncbi:hypothetical protein B0H13DRAFT_2096900 [Mycena leptocephala]|nr:hypothetical protein B0H13DRAFT_2096900 [Mycena leptocephala]